MSDILDTLIYDRIQADIDNLTIKAYIDYQDLNRVEGAIQFVSDILNRYGYGNEVQCKTNWAMREFRKKSDMERIRKNLEAIRRAYYTENTTPVTPEAITYTSIYQANFIEKIIYDLGRLIQKSFPGVNHLEFKLGSTPIGNRRI